jgi:hypothetical protein
MKRQVWFAILLWCGALLAGGCGTLSGADQQGTLSAELTEFVEESTAIASTLQARTTEIAATSAWSATSVFLLDGINQQLAVTMRAAIPPTRQIVSAEGPVTPGMNAPLPGEWTPTPLNGSPAATPDPNVTSAADTPNQLTAVGPALAVRESDGCAASVQTMIPASSPRIYATTRILNATAGTSVQASWSLGGAVVFSNNPYTIPQDDADFCVWFYIEPADVNFAPGDWSLQFLINGSPAGSPAEFTLTQ